jgi:hypothetical protein
MPRGPWCGDERGNMTRVKGEGEGWPLSPSPPYLGGWVRVWELVLGCCAVRKERQRIRYSRITVNSN